MAPVSRNIALLTPNYQYHFFAQNYKNDVKNAGHVRHVENKVKLLVGRFLRHFKILSK